MQPLPKTATELEAAFRAAGVNCSAPGFYDDPAFRAVEAKNPEILGVYAEYVDAREIDTGEADRVRLVVRECVGFLHAQLTRNVRLGACVEAAMILSRFLERLGVWNYIVKGGLSISFAASSRRGPLFIAPIMAQGNRANAGHVWVSAPPFRIVDFTVAFQPYDDRASGHLVQRQFNTPVLEESPPRTDSLEVQDFLDADLARSETRRRGRPLTLADVDELDPGALDRHEKLGTFLVARGPVRLKYISYRVSAPAEPLEGMMGLSSSGKDAIGLWEEFSAQRMRAKT